MQLLGDGLQSSRERRSIRPAALRDVVATAASATEHTCCALGEHAGLGTRGAGGIVRRDDDDRPTTDHGAEGDHGSLGTEAVAHTEHELSHIVCRSDLPERLRGDEEGADPLRGVRDGRNLTRALLSLELRDALLGGLEA